MAKQWETHKRKFWELTGPRKQKPKEPKRTGIIVTKNFVLAADTSLTFRASSISDALRYATMDFGMAQSASMWFKENNNVPTEMPKMPVTGFDHVRAILDKITYKEEVSFQWSRHPWMPAYEFRVVATRRDSEGKNYFVPVHCGEMFDQDYVENMPWGSRERWFLTKLKETIIKLELHEIDEFLKVDNKFLDHPHPEYNDLTNAIYPPIKLFPKL